MNTSPEQPTTPDSEFQPYPSPVGMLSERMPFVRKALMGFAALSMYHTAQGINDALTYDGPPAIEHTMGELLSGAEPSKMESGLLGLGSIGLTLVAIETAGIAGLAIARHYNLRDHIREELDNESDTE